MTALPWLDHEPWCAYRQCRAKGHPKRRCASARRGDKYDANGDHKNCACRPDSPPCKTVEDDEERGACCGCTCVEDRP